MWWQWLRQRLRSVLNGTVERVITVGLLAVVYFFWRHRDAAITVEGELPIWFLGAATVGLLIVVVTAYRFAGKVADARDLDELANLVDLGAFYAIHLYDALETLQKVLSGTIPNVTPGDFIESGLLHPAREFLMQRPGESVRLSVLVPHGSEWAMPFASGYRLASRQRFSLSIDASFSRHAYQSGETQWSHDLPNDPRFIPHPEATTTYHSIISTPIKSGEEVVGVLNVDSTERAAFSQPDYIYVRLLGAITSVVWSLVSDEGTSGHQPTV